MLMPHAYHSRDSSRWGAAAAAALEEFSHCVPRAVNLQTVMICRAYQCTKIHSLHTLH